MDISDIKGKQTRANVITFWKLLSFLIFINFLSNEREKEWENVRHFFGARFSFEAQL